jgi:formamidopyrimidine-DNA glycosylase
VPELPDITIYVEALRGCAAGRRLERIRVKSPFLLRSVSPPIEEAQGRAVEGLTRIGKRIVFGLEGDLFLVLHLMIAGRLLWKEPGRGPTGRNDQAAFEFESGTLILTEAGSKRRASLHLVQGRDALEAHNPGGIEILDADPGAFATALRRENRTLKRALTDPRLISGVGNSYSDEILHAARLSPIKLTGSLSDAQAAGLLSAAQRTLTLWTTRLREQFGPRFPGQGQITAFREGFAVHGRYGLPCPVCGTKVQRIVHAENETNYCPRCQTGGRVLADRSLSRLLKADWPRTVEELEEG